jgi:hypothetical protein
VRRAKASFSSPVHHIRKLQDTYFVPLSNQFRLTQRARAVTGIPEVMLHPETAARRGAYWPAITGDQPIILALRGSQISWNVFYPSALMRMSRASAYHGYAAECLKLARTAYSADARHSLLEMAAGWLALASKVEDREAELERASSHPKPAPTPEPLVAQPPKPARRPTARKGSPVKLEVVRRSRA